MDPEQTTEALTPHSLIRLPEVRRHTGLRTTAIYKLIADGDFPAPLKLGSRTSAWKWGEIVQWIESRPRAERRGGGKAA